MKKLAIAAAFSLAGSAAFAGGLDAPVAEPIIEEPVIVEDTAASSAGGILVPILFIILAAVAAS